MKDNATNYVGIGGVIGCLLLAAPGCSDTVTCASPTKLSADGTQCVYDAPPDETISCGANTRLNATAKECQVEATVCGDNQELVDGACKITPTVCQAQGTEFDEATQSCKKPSLGEIVGSSVFGKQYTHVFIKDTPTSTTVRPLGNISQETAGPGGGMVTDRDTPIYNRDAKALGGFISIAIPQFGPAVEVETPLAIDIPDRNPDGSFQTPTQQFTVQDWANCGGSAQFIKPPEPINGKNMIRMVVDMTNCLPLTLYSVWLNWSPDGTRVNNTLSAFAGGIPATVNTDESGNAHFERLLDPEIWFKSGATMPWGAQFRAEDEMVIPDITQNPNAGVLVVIIYHSNGETNGNPGQCVTGTDGMCMTPQPNIVFSLHFPVDAHTHLYTSDPIPLVDLQPY